MRLALTKRTDYAIRACLYLATLEREGPVPSREIAEVMDIPVRFLPQVLGGLARAGVVDSVNGQRGGYRLARPADGLSLLALIEAIEGPTLSTQCVLETRACRRDSPCAVHPAWSEAQEGFVSALGRRSLAEVAARYRSGQVMDGLVGPGRSALG
jgi:Rrf2 family iron-sulfur cluster assembly transcriptional regulator